MHFKFCSVTTLDPDTERFIYKNMAWKNGSMQGWIDEQTAYVRLCLLYNSQLAAWASLSPETDVGAWTLAKYRRRGYAHTAIWALLEKHKVSRRRHVLVHSKMTGHILSHLGYKTV